MLEAVSIDRVFECGAGSVRALSGVSLRIAPGELVALRGPSGSGKSTLLHLLGLMDVPTAGQIVFDKLVVNSSTDPVTLTAHRRRRVGFVFQHFQLMPSLTVARNVELPLMLCGIRGPGREAALKEALEAVGLSHKSRQYPHELSGGEMQRCAVARALVHSPALILADEPTGSLDHENGAAVLMLLRYAAKHGAMVVMATHSEEACQSATRIIGMRDGRIMSDSSAKEGFLGA